MAGSKCRYRITMESAYRSVAETLAVKQKIRNTEKKNIVKNTMALVQISDVQMSDVAIIISSPAAGVIQEQF